jgi:hypothetical protein
MTIFMTSVALDGNPEPDLVHSFYTHFTYNRVLGSLPKTILGEDRILAITYSQQEYFGYQMTIMIFL